MVLQFCKALQPAEHKMLFDNLSSGCKLMTFLRDKEMYVPVTQQVDRSRNFPASNKRDLKIKNEIQWKKFADPVRN